MVTGTTVPQATVTVTLTKAGVSLGTTRLLVGTVVVRVTNRDSRIRTFALAGKSTGAIRSGKSATLKVGFSRSGAYQYASTVAGGTSIRGVVFVFEPCATPATTTVTVRLAQDGGLTVSQTVIPCGQVTFVVSDTGGLPDSLHIFTDDPGPRASTPELQPGQAASVTVVFPNKGLVHIESGDYPPAEPEFAGDYNEEAQLTLA